MRLMPLLRAPPEPAPCMADSLSTSRSLPPVQRRVPAQWWPTRATSGAAVSAPSATLEHGRQCGELIGGGAARRGAARCGGGASVAQAVGAVAGSSLARGLLVLPPLGSLEPPSPRPRAPRSRGGRSSRWNSNSGPANSSSSRTAAAVLAAAAAARRRWHGDPREACGAGLCPRYHYQSRRTDERQRVECAQCQWSRCLALVNYIHARSSLNRRQIRPGPRLF